MAKRLTASIFVLLTLLFLQPTTPALIGFSYIPGNLASTCMMIDSPYFINTDTNKVVAYTLEGQSSII